MRTIAAILITVFVSITAFAQSHEAAWKIVPNEDVCMVTEMHFGRKQIPVEVNGKTYYGCCAGCKKTLSTKLSARQAVDPVTKKTVDKATAVIAANKSGQVLYFESKQNFEKYLGQHSHH